MALDQFLEPGLALRIRGRTYMVAPPSAWDGLRLRSHFSRADAGFDPDVERREAEAILGPVWRQMIDDRIDDTRRLHAGRTAMLHWGLSPEAAEAFWTLGRSLKPQQPSADVDLSLPGTYGPDDPGGGPLDPVSGVRQWYNDPSMAPRPVTSVGPQATWIDIFKHWDHVVLDLHEVYGTDVDSGVLHQRSWPWLELRIGGLLARDTRLAHALKKASNG